MKWRSTASRRTGRQWTVLHTRRHETVRGAADTHTHTHHLSIYEHAHEHPRPPPTSRYEALPCPPLHKGGKPGGPLSNVLLVISHAIPGTRRSHGIQTQTRLLCPTAPAAAAALVKCPATAPAPAAAAALVTCPATATAPAAVAALMTCPATATAPAAAAALVTCPATASHAAASTSHHD